jgi:hypothetical protein
MLLMDKLIFDFPAVIQWVKRHNGSIKEEAYDKALPRSASVFFEGDLNIAHEFLSLDGVRRAMIAYWTESLILLQERESSSPYAKYHNYNAIAELNQKYKNYKGGGKLL